MKKNILILLFIINSMVFSKAEVIQSDQEIISLIENHWNNTDTMSGKFKQIDTDGNIDTGNFYFNKPYKSKFTYDKTNEKIITNRLLIHILDDEGFQIDSFPIGNSPIKNILSNNIEFKEIFKIQSVEKNSEENGFYQITATNKKSKSTNEKAMFFFTTDELTLKKWVIFDEFENKTVLEFTNIQKNISMGPNIFVVRYRK